MFRVAHECKVLSANPLELLNRGGKRRIDVVRTFPNAKALLRFLSRANGGQHRGRFPGDSFDPGR
ncbi:transposase [Kineococcus sp. GCM10028916]|uniref:transposase n=1 Tax=Kineococcus sp. GCM10028916 TaxID=3273394 RepID=UPI0036415A67